MDTKKVSSKIAEVGEAVDEIVIMAVLVVIFFKFILEPLAPAITVLFVAVCTLCTFGKWTTAVISVTGILLYAGSWLVQIWYGNFLAQAICVSGILLWFAAIYWSLPERVRISAADWNAPVV